MPVNLMIGTWFPGDETQTKFQWERKPVGFDCALASYRDLLSQDKSLDDFCWIIGLEDFFNFIELINSTYVCPFNLRVYSWHARKDSPARKWYCCLWSLLATDDTCSSTSTNLGKRVSPIRAVIPARPFCKGVAANMKHCLLPPYFNNKSPYQITWPLIMLPHKSGTKAPRKPSRVETPSPWTRTCKCPEWCPHCGELHFHQCCEANVRQWVIACQRHNDCPTSTPCLDLPKPF